MVEIKELKKRLQWAYSSDRNLWRFCAVFLVLGMLFIFVTPPICTVDESAHLYRTYQVAQLNLVPERVFSNEAGGDIPKGVTDLVGAAILQDARNYSITVLASELRIRESKQTLKVEFTNVASYPAINYLPQAFGYKIAEIFTDKILVQFYAARLSNLLFLTGSFALSLYILPYARRTFALLMLLPMVFYAGGSLSADVFVLAMTMIFTALLLKLLNKEAISNSEWIYLGFAAAGLAVSKQTYYILVLTVVSLLFRRKQKPDFHEVWRVCVVLIAAAMVVCV